MTRPGASDDASGEGSPTAGRMASLRAAGPGAARWTISLLCPVLLAAYPLVSLFAQNQSEVEVTLQD